MPTNVSIQASSAIPEHRVRNRIEKSQMRPGGVIRRRHGVQRVEHRELATQRAVGGDDREERGTALVACEVG
jgi:hypothetical protein